MVPANHWVRNFRVSEADIEALANLLLEKEQPLDTETLARILVENRLAQEVEALQAKFRDAHFYNPAERYDIGQRIIFPALDFAAGVVVGQRPGVNPEYESFTVTQVQFEDPDKNGGSTVREFATELTAPHALSRSEDDDYESALFTSSLTVDEIMEAAGDDIIYELENKLSESGTLVQVAGKWFPPELLVEVNIGHLHLAEAILDVNGGGPLSTAAILSEMGGLESGSQALQEFSLNYVLKDDDRFDEVGPKGVVWWYLTRLEPAEVQQTPKILQFTPIEYDRSLLSPELLELEWELDDELSPPEASQTPRREGVITLIYPHRRVGTLPLNAATRQVFPTAQRTQRTYVTLIDGQDGEEYPGWVVKKDRYVFGLNKFYRKHKLPVGAFVTVRKGEEPGQIVIDFNAYRPRTEWVRLIVPKNNQITFEEARRSIGADYDDLMLLGADDPEGVDALFDTLRQQRRPLSAIIHNVITALAGMTPQGTVHAKTIYSAVNMVRRCPPGPIFATLVANLDFQNVGGHYWKLADH
ncbi:MAG TPA: hypothetical protein VKY59_14400 [Spirillospora sp.]|nr:hypothetical protein [Spirillospora sp.]